MELLEQIKILYPDFGATDISKMLKIRQTTIKKIIDDNNLKLIKNRRINIEDFYNIQKKEISYLLGLIWSDGHVAKRNNMVNIECISEDMLFFKEILDRIGKWSYHNRQRNDSRNTKPSTNAYICDSLLHEFLEKNDYLEKSLKSPNIIMSKISKELVKYFVLGIIDGDGCFYYKENIASQFILTGTLKQDWDLFIEIFNSIDVDCSIVRFPSKKTGYSQLRVTNKNDIRKIGKFIYFTFEDDGIGLRRKYEKYKLIVKSLEENDYIIEYIKSNKDKSVKYLTNELNISRFRLNKILKSIN
jgi:hypothetical protein